MTCRGTRELRYLCTACENATVTFWIEINRPLVKVGSKNIPGTQSHKMPVYESVTQWMRKVGQLPPWAPPPSDKPFEKLLSGSELSLYQKGLISESQSYGIGAYAYYRRIVEDTIDTLLESIAELIPPSAAEDYQRALQKVSATTIASDKIALVKGLLLATFRIEPARCSAYCAEPRHSRGV